MISWHHAVERKIKFKDTFTAMFVYTNMFYMITIFVYKRYNINLLETRIEKHYVSSQMYSLFLKRS
jgi:hypothetical protein